MVASLTELDERILEADVGRDGVVRGVSLTFAEICTRPGVYVDADVAADRLNGHRYRIVIGDDGYAVGLCMGRRDGWNIYQIDRDECERSRYYATDTTIKVDALRRW